MEVNELWEKEFWTQQEVADYFRVVPSTIINWRRQGLLSYWQPPGSSRVLYYRDEIKDFCGSNNKFDGKGSHKKQKNLSLKREKPVVVLNQPEKEWRI